MIRILLVLFSVVLSGCGPKKVMDQQWIFATSSSKCEQITVKPVTGNAFKDVANSITEDTVSYLKSRKTCQAVTTNQTAEQGILLDMSLLSVDMGGRRIAVSGKLTDSVGVELAKFKHTAVDLINAEDTPGKIGSAVADFVEELYR